MSKTTKWNYLQLLGALVSLGLAALTVYVWPERADPACAFIACGALIAATMLNLGGDQ